MERLAPLGPVYQAGTLSGNPVAVAAGLATLRAADDAVYATLDANADRLAGLLSEALTKANVPHQLSRAGQHAQRVLLRDPGDRLRVRAGERRRGVIHRSFTPCSMRASTRRAAPSRRGSFRRALDDAAFDRIADALPVGGPCRRGPGA